MNAPIGTIPGGLELQLGVGSRADSDSALGGRLNLGILTTLRIGDFYLNIAPGIASSKIFDGLPGARETPLTNSQILALSAEVPSQKEDEAGVTTFEEGSGTVTYNDRSSPFSGWLALSVPLSQLSDGIPFLRELEVGARGGVEVFTIETGTKYHLEGTTARELRSEHVDPDTNCFRGDVCTTETEAAAAEFEIEESDTVADIDRGPVSPTQWAVALALSARFRVLSFLQRLVGIDPSAIDISYQFDYEWLFPVGASPALEALLPGEQSSHLIVFSGALLDAEEPEQEPADTDGDTVSDVDDTCPDEDNRPRPTSPNDGCLALPPPPPAPSGYPSGRPGSSGPPPPPPPPPAGVGTP